MNEDDDDDKPVSILMLPWILIEVMIMSLAAIVTAPILFIELIFGKEEEQEKE